MCRVSETTLPERALLYAYRRDGSYTDCFNACVPMTVSLATYVSTFYCTLLFKLERVVLSSLLSKASSDLEARQLARGTRATWAAWTVEDRAHDQLLMTDYRGRTRSWFMTETLADRDAPATRLYFGSAVVPLSRAHDGTVTMGFGFNALIRFHRLYSLALLRAAISALMRDRRSGAKE